MYCVGTVCVGDIGFWHSVSRNISICAVWEASVEFQTAHGGRLNIHTTMVLTGTVSEHCLVNVNTLSNGYCHCHECILKKGDVLKTEEFYRNTMNETALQPDGWHLTILHHLMRPCSSIYEDEQMVEVFHPSFYSLQSVSQTICREDGEDVLSVISHNERAVQKPLAGTGSHDLREKSLIRQCLQSCAAHEEHLFCGWWVGFYQCSMMTRQTGSLWVQD